MEAKTITTLEALRDALNGVPQVQDYDADYDAWFAAAWDYARAHGLPFFFGSIVYEELPTFGGDDPIITRGAYSWDSDNLLVHDGTAWHDAPRGESEGGAS